MIFISYSHKDQVWLESLQTMIMPMLRNQTIEVWDDTRIPPGALWEKEIEKALANAQVAVLLVSPHFLASDFIHEKQLPHFLDKAKGLRVLWVLVSDCMYSETPIQNYQAAHRPLEPLDSLSPAAKNQVLKKIGEAISKAKQEVEEEKLKEEERIRRQLEEAKEVVQLRIQLQQLKTQHLDLQSQLEQSHKQQDELNIEQNRLKEQIEQQKSKYEQALSEREFLWKREHERQKTDQLRLEQELQGRQLEYEQAISDRELAWDGERAELERQLNQNQNLAKKMDEEKQELIQKVKQKDHYIEQLKSHIREKDHQINELQRDKSRLRRQREEDQVQIQRQAERIHQLTSQLSREEFDEPPKESVSPFTLDTTYLQSLLEVGKWEDADYETCSLMLKSVGRSHPDWIRKHEINKFPCANLNILDQLWGKYSQGRFGFSAQKWIYLETGNPLDGQYYKENFEVFGERVGWRTKGRWISYEEVMFNISAPLGHLPLVWIGLFVFGCIGEYEGIPSLLQRLDEASSEELVDH